jgi:TetR/AcrR family transcriptional regulator, tetracycline repressor protein
MKKSPGRPKSSNLNKSSILKQALKIIDKDGVKNLSMRALAKNLKVDPMAVYHYIPSKEILIQEIVALAFNRLQTDLPSRKNWQEEIKLLLDNYRNLVRQHPNLIYFIITTPSYSIKPSLEFNEKLFMCLSSSTLSKQKGILLGNLLIDYLHGYSLAESSVKNKTPSLDPAIFKNYPYFKLAYEMNSRNYKSIFKDTIDLILASFS